MLFSALIGPYFVDWTSYRETFEREASSYIGRPVTVAGKASVRLLPTPVISFTDIRVGDADEPDVEMERFRAEVELASLLEGRVRVLQMAVERPHFRIDIARLVDNRIPAEGSWQLDPERISLERLEITDGSALVSDSRTGRTWEAQGIDALVEADTLMGPGKLTASLAFDGKPFDVSVGFGRMTENNSVALKASVRSPDYPVTLALDGEYQLPGDEPGKYEGAATIEGVPPADQAAPRSPWADFRASGELALAPADLSFDEVQVSYGAMERPLILVAAGKVGLGAEPSFDLSLSARQIDIDRTLGGGTVQPVAIGEAISTLVGQLPGIELPPLPGKVRLDAQGVVLGGGVLQAVSVDLATAVDGWLVENFSATLPGDTQLDLKGSLGIAPTMSFGGHARLSSTQPAAFAAWWRGEAGSATKIGRFSVEADLELSPDVQKASNLVAKLGEGTVSGSLDVKRARQSNEVFATVILSADRADLVETRALAELFQSKSLISGELKQLTLSLSADVLTAGAVEARSVSVEGGLEDGVLNLRRLWVADLAGANIDASARINDPFGSPSGRIGGSVEASDFTGAANFLASFVPESRIAQRLSEAAPILSPVSARVSAEGGAAGEPLTVSLTGSFADTHVTLEANGAGSLGDPASLTGTVALNVDGADSAKVLRQLGLTPLPVRSKPLKIDANFDGELASAGKLTVKGTVAGIDLDYAGETSFSDGQVGFAGDVTATSADVDPLLLLSGIALPGVGEGHAASASGRLEYSGGNISLGLTEGSFGGQPVAGALQARIAPNLELSGELTIDSASLPFLAGFASGIQPGVAEGRWTDKALTPSLPPGTAIDLTLNAATLDLGAPIPARQAKLRLFLDGPLLNLDLDEAEFAAGTLKGALAANFHDGEAEVTLRGALQGGELQAFVWDQAGLPAASGKLDVSIDATGRGRSMAGIVSTLSGSGSLSIDEGRLNSMNGEALPAVMAAAEEEDQPDEQKARETFAQLFDAGALEFGRAVGTFSIADGVVEIPTVSMSGGTTTILAEGHLDLNSLTLGSDWVIRTSGSGDGEQPTVQMKFSGPIVEPQRRIDVTPLLNLLQARFTQIQLDKIQDAEQRNAETERRLAEMERQQSETRRQAAADQRDLETPAVPPRPASPASPTPTFDPAMIEIGPDLPPPETAAPIELVPQQPTTRRTRRVTPPAVPPPPGPRESFESEYRTLPNGTIVKIR